MGLWTLRNLFTLPLEMQCFIRIDLKVTKARLLALWAPQKPSKTCSAGQALQRRIECSRRIAKWLLSSPDGRSRELGNCFFNLHRENLAGLTKVWAREDGPPGALTLRLVLSEPPVIRPVQGRLPGVLRPWASAG